MPSQDRTVYNVCPRSSHQSMIRLLHKLWNTGYLTQIPRDSCPVGCPCTTLAFRDLGRRADTRTTGFFLMVWSVQAPPHHAKSIHSFFSSTIMKVWSLVVTILYSSLRADAAVLDDRYGSAVATEQLQSSRDTTLGEHSLEDCTFQAFSGDWCDGDAGPLEAVSGDSSCFVATDRHSYRIGTGCPRLWYNYYVRPFPQLHGLVAAS